MNVPLCRTCRNFKKANVGSLEITAYGNIRRKEMNYCSEYYVHVEREATECRKYDDVRTPHLNTMKQMAYILEKKRIIGFENPVYEFKKPENKYGYDD